MSQAKLWKKPGDLETRKWRLLLRNSWKAGGRGVKPGIRLLPPVVKTGIGLGRVGEVVHSEIRPGASWQRNNYFHSQDVSLYMCP